MRGREVVLAASTAVVAFAGIGAAVELHDERVAADRSVEAGDCLNLYGYVSAGKIGSIAVDCMRDGLWPPYVKIDTMTAGITADSAPSVVAHYGVTQHDRSEHLNVVHVLAWTCAGALAGYLFPRAIEGGEDYQRKRRAAMNLADTTSSLAHKETRY